MDNVFMDWTSMYFEAPENGIVRLGYSRDLRRDRPQVTVGLSMDRATGMPIGLTVNPGNIIDVTHFDETFRQLRPLLPDDAMLSSITAPTPRIMQNCWIHPVSVSSPVFS